MSEHEYAEMDDVSKWNATVGNINALGDLLLRDYEECGKDFLIMGNQFMSVPLPCAQGAFGSVTFLIVANSAGEISDHIATTARINSVFLEHRDEFFSMDERLRILMRRDAWWTYVMSMNELVSRIVMRGGEDAKKAIPSQKLMEKLDAVFPKEWVKDVASREGSILKLVMSPSLSEEVEQKTNGKNQVLH